MKTSPSHINQGATCTVIEPTFILALKVDSILPLTPEQSGDGWNCKLL